MDHATSIRFGTDGWRAVIGDEFTFDNVRQVTQAFSDYFTRRLARSTKRQVAVGFDRRFLSSEFAQTVAEVLAANGFTVLLAKRPVPTPAVSWMTAKRRCRAGIMITASHNPARFNGFKIKLHHGGPADPETCRSIEALIGQRPVKHTKISPAVRRRTIRQTDFTGPYFNALRQLVDFKLISKCRADFAHEALFGVGAGCFEEILKGTQCRVRTFNSDHDPNFGGLHPEPVARNYSLSQRSLVKEPADFCLVTDGDADRIGGMDGTGTPLSTHQIICLLLHHFVRNRKGRGRVVKALTTTSMVDVMCERHDLPLTTTGVGFKFISEEMLKGDVLLGVEESGGIGFPEHVPERDGLLAGLMILELLAFEQKPLTQLLAQLRHEYGLFEYGRVDTHFPLSRRTDLMQQAAKTPPSDLLGSPVDQVQTFDGVKYTARNGCWLMLRGSGTEPVLRIYAEAPTTGGVDRLLKVGQGMAAQFTR